MMTGVQSNVAVVTLRDRDEPVHLLVSVDWDRLLTWLARRVIRNKERKTVAISGLIKAKAVRP